MRHIFQSNSRKRWVGLKLMSWIFLEKAKLRASMHRKSYSNDISLSVILRNSTGRSDAKSNMFTDFFKSNWGRLEASTHPHALPFHQEASGGNILMMLGRYWSSNSDSDRLDSGRDTPVAPGWTHGSKTCQTGVRAPKIFSRVKKSISQTFSKK